MENSSSNTSRSISLPSRLNPCFSRIEINLNKLKTLEPLDSSSTRIDSALACLPDLYISVDELIGSSQMQKVNLQSGNKALIEDALARSTRLMDVYSDLVELLAQMKNNVRVLQFALRRKGMGVYSTTDGHVLDYFISRKKAKKNIVASLGSLEQLEREIESYDVAGEDHHFWVVIRVLREIVIATIGVFRNVLLIVSGKQKHEKGFSWIAMLMPAASSEKRQEGVVNEADIIDVTLDALWKDIKNECKTVEVDMVMERLHTLDNQIAGYEVGLDSVFRKLIQTRVSLLNIRAN